MSPRSGLPQHARERCDTVAALPDLFYFVRPAVRLGVSFEMAEVASHLALDQSWAAVRTGPFYGLSGGL